MWRFAGRSIGLTVVICALASFGKAEERLAASGCNFDAYHPVKLGTPIRGGHEDLAIEKVAPIYPSEAQQKGIGGRVDVQVLINRAGDVVKSCGVGPSLLQAVVDRALSKWRFQKDFGVGFAGSSPVEPKYAVLTLSFYFNPRTDSRGRADATPGAEDGACARGISSVVDERGVPIWLSSDDLMRRAVKRSNLSFPGLGHGHLRGEVQLDLLIDEQGKVACAQAIRGHPIAIASAMSTIRGWEFKPFVRAGSRRPVLGHLTIAYDVGR